MLNLYAKQCEFTVYEYQLNVCQIISLSNIVDERILIFASLSNFETCQFVWYLFFSLKS